jgi:hypothetical protein
MIKKTFAALQVVFFVNTEWMKTLNVGICVKTSFCFKTFSGKIFLLHASLSCIRPIDIYEMQGSHTYPLGQIDLYVGKKFCTRVWNSFCLPTFMSLVWNFTSVGKTFSLVQNLIPKWRTLYLGTNGVNGVGNIHPPEFLKISTVQLSKAEFEVEANT